MGREFELKREDVTEGRGANVEEVRMSGSDYINEGKRMRACGLHAYVWFA